jgi:hypothetical protein
MITALSTLALVLGALFSGIAALASAAAASTAGLPLTDPDWRANPGVTLYDEHGVKTYVGETHQINRTGCMQFDTGSWGLSLSKATPTGWQTVWAYNIDWYKYLPNYFYEGVTMTFNRTDGLKLKTWWDDGTWDSGTMTKTEWKTGGGSSMNDLKLQGDGNLVIYDTHGKPLWASNTFC